MIHLSILTPAFISIAAWTLKFFGSERRQARNRAHSHAIATFITNEFGY